MTMKLKVRLKTQRFTHQDRDKDNGNAAWLMYRLAMDALNTGRHRKISSQKEILNKFGRHW